MHLDALVTYDDVITICSRGDEVLANWWNGPDFGEERSRGRHNRDVALLVARFRHALMLGHGDRIAEQWWLRTGECDHEQHWDARQRQRGNLRALASRRLDRYDRPITAIRTSHLPFTPSRGRADVLSTDWPSTLPKDEPGERAKALRLYLCTLSQYEFERLIADYPNIFVRVRRLAKRDPVELVTMRGLQSSLIWAVLRRAMAQANMSEPVGYQPVWQYASSPDWLTELLADGSWPVTEKRLRSSIAAVVPRLGHAIWHEHYNVACVCAVALLPRTGTTKSEPENGLRKLAISHLYRAAAGSHSGYLAQRRSWLLYEDPDLASLRGTPEFRNFEMVTFSPPRQVPVRPRRTHVWELVCYQVQLISCIARRMRDVWFERELATVAPDAHPGPTPWYTMEAKAWRQIVQLAVSHRDWRTRHESARFLADELPGQPLGLPTFTQERLYSRYANAVGEDQLRQWLEGPTDPIAMVNEIAEEYIESCNQRMAGLARDIHGLDRRRASDPCDNAYGAVGGIRITGSALVVGLDEDTRSPRAVRRLCLERGALWGALADLFDDDLEGPAPKERLDAFRTALRRPGLIGRLVR
jgi:hypothetical protein